MKGLIFVVLVAIALGRYVLAPLAWVIQEYCVPRLSRSVEWRYARLRDYRRNKAKREDTTP